MNITFANTKLKKWSTNDSQAIKKLGALRAKKFKQRLDDLAVCNTLEVARNLPGRYHELTGDRKGQWACDLDHPYRLIFTPHEDPIPTDEDGKYVWIEILGIEFLEIVDYH